MANPVRDPQTFHFNPMTQEYSVDNCTLPCLELSKPRGTPLAAFANRNINFCNSVALDLLLDREDITEEQRRECDRLQGQILNVVQVADFDVRSQGFDALNAGEIDRIIESVRRSLG